MFSLAKTKSSKNNYNTRTNKKFNWLQTIPWELFGFEGAFEEISIEDIKILQESVGQSPDGLLGLNTLRALQEYVKDVEGQFWNPFSGELLDFSDIEDIQYVVWNNLKVPVSIDFRIISFDESEGLDLHSTGSFSTRNRDINSLVLHWGGLNPQHLHRVFLNRKASSHFAVGVEEGTQNVYIYQYLDLAHIAWHAVGSNENSIGIDICQQPETKFLGYYNKNNYKVQVVENPSHSEGFGPKKILSLDPRISYATSELLRCLQESFQIPQEFNYVSEGSHSKESMLEGGIFSHFQLDFKGQGKWDVAPWWDEVISKAFEENLT